MTIVREPIASTDLELPFCVTPRPGDRVVWYQDALKVHGRLLGHKPDGRPCIFNDFEGMSFLPSFDYLRLENSGVRLGPIWDRLPADGIIVRPTEDEIREFDKLLNRTTSPGLKYIDLITEIYERGYEIFAVGGTVRDVLSGLPTKDVDLVTTMPLIKAAPLVRSMYRQYKKFPPEALKNGHARLGGGLDSPDPFIDLCVFKYQMPGTVDAVFGGDFERDLGHRDFACNSVYYDPINKALVDPSGRGISDAESKVLSLICNSEMRSQYHVGQIAIRFFKFWCRGYEPASECLAEIREALDPCLTAMETSIRVAYMHTQWLGKHPKAEHSRRLDEVRTKFVEVGAVDIWNRLIEPFRDDILA